MPRKQAVNQAIYLDEAEGFILEHALFSPPRTWPPLPPEPQEVRLANSRKKMDWDEEVRAHPDKPIDIPFPTRKRSITHKERALDGDEDEDEDEDEAGDSNKERCVICLMELKDRTIVGMCGHEFCFECIGVWANQSRRCPLCSADMAPFLLHDLNSSTPTKFYLPPLPSRRFPSASLPGPSRSRLPEIIRRERIDERDIEPDEPDELDIQVERRREIYRYGLYVKHIGSNPHTKYRPTPTPRQFSEDPSLIQRATAFLRRELRVWQDSIDVEFLTTYIISLLKTIDIRSDPAIRLLADYLDSPSTTNENRPPHTTVAEHFSHELYSFLRSPFKELRKWDEVIQYDPIPTSSLRSHSSRSPSPVRSVSLSPRSLRSGSPSSSPDRCGRNWNRRDVFVPSVSPDAKRWDENDTWLDPEYAAWLEEEKRREEDRRERKRLKRSSRRESQLQLESKPMRAWGEGEARKERVELLPEPPEPPLRMDVDGKEEEEVKPTVGLTIKGVARSTSSLITTPAPSEPAARRRLIEKLNKEKANGPSQPVVEGGTTRKMTLEEMKERLLRLKSESAARSSPSMSSTNDKTVRLKEKLARLKAEASISQPVSSVEEDQDRDQNTQTETEMDDNTLFPIDQNTYNHENNDDQYENTYDNAHVSHVGRNRMSESKRREIRIKTRLETERIIYVKNTNESKAQELRRRILQNKAKREKEQMESNFGGMKDDKILSSMDVEERKKEVRRRLMRLKMLGAETEQERRARVLKERLMEKKRKSSLPNGVVEVAA
ncbi:hypothetical protein I203_100969 [Kwoniella mangroviensis CBS 8507]|uniref:uncharacterized protein n=1 Tax=Kwoniella mangroviensis CBS 8507 TaxID=1296122 RepID=UPI00080CC1CF|nr:uncharacterized protein I203_02609 [Kwoniella mangroviensis CBS 8507]OCF67951.1 hypothetical protein I203_02609 [Kwoniella mangroviensis CBS 8507]